MSSPEILDGILLSSVEGIGARTYRQLLERFGSATAILNANRSSLSGFEFLKPDTLDRLLSARNYLNPSHIVQFCRQEGIDIIPLQDERYPKQLKTIIDPPPLLYVQGQILLRDELSIAVIGTRRSTSYGNRLAEKLTAALVSNGISIIGGLALGIDGIAHRTALQNGGRTLAVLGGGLKKIYPPEHIQLAEEIVQSGGALVSEYPPLHPPAKWTFPQRNRIISGLSLGVLVVEAPLKSGAMISARMAGEQGRDVFAVPGQIDSAASRGCHKLIKDGAFLTESADDILDVLGLLRQPLFIEKTEPPMRHPNEVSLNEIEQTVLQHIQTAATEIEAVVSQSHLALHQILTALDVLKRKRMIRQLSPTCFIRI
ncbi:DNA polymerase III [Planctomycetales bacterium]|nr:DNA polymerase III [Planctomycetales bacterium]